MHRQLRGEQVVFEAPRDIVLTTSILYLLLHRRRSGNQKQTVFRQFVQGWICLRCAEPCWGCAPVRTLARAKIPSVFVATLFVVKASRYSFSQSFLQELHLKAVQLLVCPNHSCAAC